MKYFDTFTGIGGFTLAINKAYENNEVRPLQQEIQRPEYSGDIKSGWGHTKSHCVGYSEIDKYASSIYQRHFPNHKNYGDITKINADELPDFDLLVGGFPCQAFSIAGKRAGFEDTRGTLFFDLARILRTKKPRLFVFENVKGLLSHDKGNTFKTIISTLDELGYDCQWQVLNSKNFGVPQNRERVFIVGHLRGTRRPEVFPFGGTTEQALDIKQIGHRKGFATNMRTYDPEGISGTLDTAGGGGREVHIQEATKKGYAEAYEGDSINLSVPNSKTRRGRVGKGIAQTIDTGMQQHTLQDMKIRRLTPTECERLQGFPDGWTAEGRDKECLRCKGKGVIREGWNGMQPSSCPNCIINISDTQRYKCCGNAVTVNVVEEIIKKLK